MSSVAGPDLDAERTGSARIRDAAIRCFGERGVDGTSLKVIAETAGVSQPLIIHHFGSKQGLRVACDEHVAATIRANKLDAVAQGPQLDPLASLRQVEEQRPILRYLATTLGDHTPEVATLLDEMVEDAVEYTAEGERTGMVRPSDHPRARVIVLLLWSFGALTLHEHMERLLGVDLLGDGTDLASYALPALEILAKGVLAEGLYDRARDAADGQHDAR